jgi:hypothetical protein
MTQGKTALRFDLYGQIIRAKHLGIHLGILSID